MIEVAEKLIAERGIGAVSLRAVLRESGQRNKSAAHYHFGSLPGLIDAVIEERGAPVREYRDVQFDAWRPSDGARGLVHVLVGPAAEFMLRPDSYYARFLAQVTSDPELHTIVQRRQHTPNYQETLRLLRDAHPQVPPALWQTRLDRVTLMTINILARWEATIPSGVPVPALAADLTDSVLRVLSGPLSPETTAALEPATTL
ncbi:TetR/AcrR family transcriptional regulator [Nocardioides sp. BGMRC 2183]|nr:TetR/AcrR family transcriptional regulator [Nocardioides sp. BGMRC 2183]